VDTERAETWLRLMAEAGLRRALQSEPDAALAYLPRVRAVAAALAAVGAIEPERAAAITGDLAAALELRLGAGRGKPPPLAQVPPASLVAFAAGPPPSLAPRRGPAERSGEMHAVPVGQMLVLRDEYMTADVWVLSLVRTPGRALFTVSARTNAASPFGLHLPPFTRIHAVDHRGNSYRVRPYGRHAMGETIGWLSIQPRPPTGTPWLEFYPAGGKSCIRVDLATPAGTARVAAEPGAPDDPAGRLLDAAAMDLLGGLEPGHHAGHGHLTGYLAAALAAAGALPPGSPAAGRLAGLCQRTGATAGRRLVAALEVGIIPAVELPAPWTSVLTYFGRRHWPPAQQGVAPLAVVLPELDGIRFLLTGLIADADGTRLSVAALGLPHSDHHDELTMPWIHWFPWWVKDSSGQCHLAELDSLRAEGGDFSVLVLRLVPPLPRSVTRLEVIVPGKAVRLRVTIPLSWAQPQDGGQ
jgi:hypothetical protein